MLGLADEEAAVEDETEADALSLSAKEMSAHGKRGGGGHTADVGGHC